jgi:uncharacterized membrane protein
MILMNKKTFLMNLLAAVLILPAMFWALPAIGEVSITNPLGPTTTFAGLLDKIVVGVAEIIAALSTIMITIAGILYLTSAGSPEKVNTAKKAITYAIIGIVIAVSASMISLIIKSTLGVTS